MKSKDMTYIQLHELATGCTAGNVTNVNVTCAIENLVTKMPSCILRKCTKVNK